MAMRALAAVILLTALPGGVPAGAAAPPPQPAEALVLAKVLAADGEVREALGLLRSAVEAVPTEPYLRLELATMAFRVGRADEAAEQAREALRLGAGDRDVVAAVADLFVGLSGGRGELLGDARAAYEALLRLSPDDPEALQALARLHHAQGDLPRAEELYRRLVTVAPESGPAGERLLQLLLQRGKKAEAAELLRERVAAEPAALDRRLALADLLSESGDHAEAVAVLRAAPVEQAADDELRRRLAFELYRGGDAAAAAALVEEMLSAGADLRLRLFHALLLEEQGRSQEALAELQGLRGELPDDPEVSLALARMLAREDQAPEAERLLRELLGQLPAGEVETADRVRLELARLLAEGGAWPEVLRLASEVSPRAEEALRGAALLLRIEALIELDRPEEALAALQSGNGLGEATLAARRAEVLLGLGRDEEAAAELAKLGTDPPGRLRAAEAFLRAGRHRQAVPLLEGLVAGDPDSSELRFRLGAAYERSGSRDEAVTAFRELLRLSPDHHLGLNYLGYMWAEHGENLLEARRLIERALELDPGNPAYIDSLGWVFFQMGDHQAALAQLEHAARLLPGDATIQEHLGDVLRVVGKVQEARAAYERAVALADDNRDQARRKLEEVERDLSRQ